MSRVGGGGNWGIGATFLEVRQLDVRRQKPTAFYSSLRAVMGARLGRWGAGPPCFCKASAGTVRVEIWRE